MFKRALGLGVAIIVGVMLVSASGAATTKAQKVTKIDVSTRAAVVHYLRSIHVNTKGVVIQRGLRNYAGAHCPGARWTCASTKHTVVQIAKRGGLNRFACSTAKCVVAQFGRASGRLHAASRSLPAGYPSPQNLATCIKTSGITGSCLINQPNTTGTNEAVVWMDSGLDSGLVQSATFSASITQGPASVPNNGASNWNLACVHQLVNIDGSATKTNGASVTVNDDSHQSVSITQNSLSGKNVVQGAISGGTKTHPTYDCGTAGSSLTQSETLTSTVATRGSITQNQDAAANGPNVLLDIEQNHSGGFQCTTPLNCPSSGTNTASFTQTSFQQAIANKTGTSGSVSQTQSSPDVAQPYSGLVGTINQDSSGPSTTNATQNETQCEDAFNTATDPPGGLQSCEHPTDQDAPSYPLTQTQYGPEGVFKSPASSGHGPVHYAHKGYGQATLTGNSGDHITINQTSHQWNDGGAGSKQYNTQEGDCFTPNVPANADPPGCNLHQTTDVNGTTTQNDQSGSDVTGNINCTPGVPCTPGGQTGPICNAGTGNTGAAYNAIPTDIVHCGAGSIGFEATSTNEFGDEVTLDTAGGNSLQSLMVDLQSFGCGDSGHWNTGASDPCETTAGETFSIPITATIYSVGTGDTVGAPLATATANPNIPYRPSADPTDCPQSGGNGEFDTGSKWFDPVAGACRYSISYPVTFTNWSSTPTFTNGQKVIWTVQYDTSNAGYNPVGTQQGCNLLDQGCGYDSLNVGTMSFPNAPYAGTDVNGDVAFRSYDSPGYSGNHVPLAAETGWTGFRPLGEIVLGQVIP